MAKATTTKKVKISRRTPGAAANKGWETRRKNQAEALELQKKQEKAAALAEKRKAAAKPKDKPTEEKGPETYADLRNGTDGYRCRHMPLPIHPSEAFKDFIKRLLEGSGASIKNAVPIPVFKKRSEVLQELGYKICRIGDKQDAFVLGGVEYGYMQVIPIQCPLYDDVEAWGARLQDAIECTQHYTHLAEQKQKEMKGQTNTHASDAMEYAMKNRFEYTSQAEWLKRMNDASNIHVGVDYSNPNYRTYVIDGDFKGTPAPEHAKGGIADPKKKAKDYKELAASINMAHEAESKLTQGHNIIGDMDKVVQNYDRRKQSEALTDNGMNTCGPDPLTAFMDSKNPHELVEAIMNRLPTIEALDLLATTKGLLKNRVQREQQDAEVGHKAAQERNEYLHNILSSK